MNACATDEEVLFTFYDFPAQHWAHLRTTNPIESTFGTVRHRTRQTKGCGSRIATLTMIFKLATDAEKHWHRLKGYKLITQVIQGVPFVDGEGERFERRFFRNDLATLENLYRGAGYLSVKIVGRVFELDEKGKLYIRLKIDSGPRWTVADVAVDVEGQGADHTAARDRIRVASGQHFRYADVLADEREVLVFLNNRSYAHARVENRIDYDPAAHSADVFYHVDPGRRMYFGAIEIVGRAGVDAGMKTDRTLVHDHLTFRQGQRFNPADLRRTRSKLAATNLFRSVTVHMPEVAAGDSVQPVQIQLQERKFIHLEANAFVNNEEPGLSGNARHENWLGRGTHSWRRERICTSQCTRSGRRGDSPRHSPKFTWSAL